MSFARPDPSGARRQNRLGHGGTRNTFQVVPDAPVSKFMLSLPAGKERLLQNSTDICKGFHRATADFTAHNGKTSSMLDSSEGCEGMPGQDPLGSDCAAGP